MEETETFSTLASFSASLELQKETFNGAKVA